MDNNLSSLISLLIKATNRQLIEWSTTSSIGIYAVKLNSAVYSVSSDNAYRLWLDNDASDPICLSDSISDVDAFSQLSELYTVARDSAEKRSATINASIDELNSLIAKDDLPF